MTVKAGTERRRKHVVQQCAQAMPPNVSLEEKVNYLASASAWPGRRSPEVVETHMSWVFLGADRVLKLKKPVRTSFLDFSTLAAREFNCREEVRLNRRLAPDVYLGVQPLLQRPDGRLEIGHHAAAGVVVDWLVLMRPLDRARMLDAAVTAGTVRPADIDRLAARLADFFRCAEPVRLSGAAYVERFVAAQAMNRSILLQPLLRAGETDAALDAFDRALQRHAPQLVARAEAGHLREGHGDLRPEHVGLDGTPVVIDCLEFNRALREVDPFDELSFLDLECRMLGADWIGPRLIAHCATALGDAPPAEVLSLYMAHRALLRARLAVAHLLDPVPRTPARWLPLSRRYATLVLGALAP
jgi:aminoglycoside phosphotransferase family enzyme